MFFQSGFAKITSHNVQDKSDKKTPWYDNKEKNNICAGKFQQRKILTILIIKLAI